MALEQQQIRLLMHEAAVEEGLARRAGDAEQAAYWRERREMYNRLYTGVGTIQDELEAERESGPSPLESIGNIASAGALAIAAMAAFMIFGRGR